MAGFHTYVDDELVDADTLNEFVRDQVVTIFASTAARDAAVTSPVHGQTVSVAAGGTPPVLYQWDASTSAWVTVGGSPYPVSFAFANDTHTTDTNATPVEDADLFLTLEPLKTYLVDAYLLTNADTTDTVNIRVSWSWTGDASLTGQARFCDGPAPTIPSTDQAVAVDLAVQLATVDITAEVVYAAAVNGVSRVHEHLVVRTGSSSGVLALKWAQGTSDADPLHVFAGSHIRAERVDADGWVDPVEIG